MPERFSPLVNYVDLSTQQGMIALVWKIRQAGEIRYPDLYEDVFGQAMTQSDGSFETSPISLQQVFAFYQAIVQLYRNGIIETMSNVPEESVISKLQHYDAGSAEDTLVLRVSKRVAFIQNLFNISLTEIVFKGQPLKSHPVFGEPIDDFEHTWSDVFVIMPFRDEFHNVYHNAIKPSVIDAKLTLLRGDDFFSDRRIMDEVWSAIFYCKLCVVECTGHNPNVFYELGIAHILGRPTIMIAREGQEIPFDVSDRRIIFYEDTEDGLKALRETLYKTIRAEMIATYGEDS